ncbi:hypothetical protein FS749_004733 [Ceratobasidium sp. UAMH 11750]|nr:hypothetical protein FS749_004733 [Ceratobasidium sp. UAMH 11750]
MDPSQMTPEQLEELAKAIFSTDKPAHFGNFILGALIDALLCGFLLMQCGSYIGLCAKDHWLLKVAVAWVILMNLCGTSLIWAWLWEVFVVNFGTYRTLFSLKYTLWTALITYGTTVPVQLFFGLRAWKILNRSLVFGVVVSMLTLAYAAMGLAVTIMQWLNPITTFALKTLGITYSCIACLVVSDLLITTTILWYIVHWRGGNRRSQDLIKKAARITFESQLPPTLLTIALAGTFSPAQNNPATVPIIWAQPKLYGISLLHTLNMRQELAAPDVIVGTVVTGPSRTTGIGSLRFPVGPTQTGDSDITPHNQAISDSQNRTHFPTRPDPPKATMVSFGGESVERSPNDILKLDVLPVVSHVGSSVSEMEMGERKSGLPDPESHTTTAC